MWARDDWNLQALKVCSQTKSNCTTGTSVRRIVFISFTLLSDDYTVIILAQVYGQSNMICAQGSSRQGAKWTTPNGAGSEEGHGRAALRGSAVHRG